MEGEVGALYLTASDPFTAVIVLNSIHRCICTRADTHVLNAMFRHISVPRDTSVLCEIIIVCCESVGNCQTLSNDGPSQVWIISYFVLCFLFFASDGLVSYLFLSAPSACFVHCFYFYQQKALYITWCSVMWLYFRFSSERAKLNCVTLSVNFENFVVKLHGICIILLTDLLCGITSYYVSIDLRFVCIVKIRNMF